MNLRAVLDTNLYVSYLMLVNSVPGQAVAKVWENYTTLFSIDTWEELRTVLARPKLSRFILPNICEPFLEKVWAISEHVSIATPIRACRDPRDDKFLEVAVHGRADVIVSGDQDLLVLHPFRGIPILTPAVFLTWSPHPLS